MTKFNIHWQLVRTQARDIKSVNDKIHHVVGHLQKNPSPQNHARVQNWMRMTALGYPTSEREPFEKMSKHLQDNKHKYTAAEAPEDFSKVSTDDLRKVHKDLSNRKYGFQFKKVPKAHTEFMKKLEDEISKR